jgi:histidine ammonia-lyase
LEKEHINKFVPKSKEGLALTNGTTFMASILCVALKRQKQVFEQIMLTTCLFLDSIKAVDSAFF